jgi:hypothetical protein
MQKQHYSVVIDAPKEKVWDIMLQDATYRQWTEPFSPGSYFEGRWDQGADIRFLTKNEKGLLDGMISRIRENRPYDFVSIEHIGMVRDGVDDMSSDEIKKWAGAREEYTFRSADGKTEVGVDIDVDDAWADMFKTMWPAALDKLKALAEGRV